MLLTPDIADRLDVTIARFGASLTDSLAQKAFEALTASTMTGEQSPGRHEDAVALTRTFGMNPLDEPPSCFLSWDGCRVRTDTEPAVLIHEVAHFQIASPARRSLPDFGLGPGPESGAVAIAEAARCVADPQREIEEQMASLLGILWETALGHRAIDAFVEQNWLEGAGRSSTAAFFTATLRRLYEAGLIGRTGVPTLALNARSGWPLELHEDVRTPPSPRRAARGP